MSAILHRGCRPFKPARKFLFDAAPVRLRASVISQQTPNS